MRAISRRDASRHKSASLNWIRARSRTTTPHPRFMSTNPVTASSEIRRARLAAEAVFTSEDVTNLHASRRCRRNATIAIASTKATPTATQTRDSPVTHRTPRAFIPRALPNKRHDQQRSQTPHDRERSLLRHHDESPGHEVDVVLQSISVGPLPRPHEARIVRIGFPRSVRHAHDLRVRPAASSHLRQRMEDLEGMEAMDMEEGRHLKGA